MALDTQNREIRKSQSATFDKRMDALHDRLYKDLKKKIKSASLNYKIDIGKMIMPTESEQNNKRIAKRFTKMKIQILRNVSILVRSLVAGRNKISLFNMLDSNGQNNTKFQKKYNKIRNDALARLSVGVGLIKFDDKHKLPLSTMLFPTANTKYYTIRYGLLKHKMLNKVKVGIKNLQFTAPTNSIGKWAKSKIGWLKTKVNVPIDSFLIPASNSKFFTFRYNWHKHKMLSKVAKGIKNLSFVTQVPLMNDPGNSKLRYVTLTKKVEVPIDSFLIPTGNSFLYNVRFGLLKHKLLNKVSKGIKSLTFTTEKLDIIDKFFTDTAIDTGVFSKSMTKTLCKMLERQQKQPNKQRKNEYNRYKENKFERVVLSLDKIRNSLLARLVNGNSARPAGVINTKLNKKTGVFEPFGFGKIAAGGILSNVLTKGLSKNLVGLGKGMLIAGAAFAGWEMGKWLDEKLDITKRIQDWNNKRLDKKFNHKTAEDYMWRYNKNKLLRDKMIKANHNTTLVGASDNEVINAYKKAMTNIKKETKKMADNRATYNPDRGIKIEIDKSIHSPDLKSDYQGDWYAEMSEKQRVNKENNEIIRKNQERLNVKLGEKPKVQIINPRQPTHVAIPDMGPGF